MYRPKIKWFNNYKQANLFLGLGLVFCLLLIWQLNLKNTWNAHKKNKQLAQRVSYIQQKQVQLPKMKEQLQLLDEHSVKKYEDRAIMKVLSLFCEENNMLIKDFSAPESFNQKGIKYWTQNIEVQGTFKDITQLAYLLEHQEKLGSIASLDFYSEEDRYLKKTFLKASFVLRNIE